MTTTASVGGQYEMPLSFFKRKQDLKKRKTNMVFTIDAINDIVKEALLESALGGTPNILEKVRHRKKHKHGFSVYRSGLYMPMVWNWHNLYANDLDNDGDNDNIDLDNDMSSNDAEDVMSMDSNDMEDIGEGGLEENTILPDNMKYGVGHGMLSLRYDNITPEFIERQVKAIKVGGPAAEMLANLELAHAKEVDDSPLNRIVQLGSKPIAMVDADELTPKPLAIEIDFFKEDVDIETLPSELKKENIQFMLQDINEVLVTVKYCNGNLLVQEVKMPDRETPKLIEAMKILDNKPIEYREHNTTENFNKIMKTLKS